MMVAKFVSLRLRSFFTVSRIDIKWVFGAMTFLSILVAGYAMSRVGNMILTDKVEDMSFYSFTASIVKVLFTFTFFRMIVPAYAPMQKVFEKYHPIPLFQKYVIGFLSDILRPYFLFAFSFILVFAAGLQHYQWEVFATAVSMLFTAHLLRRYIQYIIDYRLSKLGIVTWGIGAMSGILYIGYIFHFQNGQYSNLVFFIAPIILFFSGFWFERNSISEKTHKGISLLNGRFLLRFLLGRAKNRTVILLAIFIKILLLLAFWGSFQETGELLFESNFIFYIVFSPIAIFTYAFNNTWAFWGSLWARAQLAGGFREVRNQQLRLMAIPLLFDMIITLTYILIGTGKPFIYSIIYLGSTISLIPLSIVWSVVKPKKVKSAIQMGPLTSLLGNIVTFLVFLLTALVAYNIWWAAIIPFLFLISLAGYYYVYKNYEVYKEKLLRVVE